MSVKQVTSSYKEDDDQVDEITPKAKVGQLDGKFHFKMNNKQTSTVYGSKFLDMRKTFQNFNSHSNKALNDP